MTRKDPVLIVTAGIVGVAAIVASFVTLMHLAEFVGWAGHTTWLLPACLDALALGAGRVWLSSAFDAEARRYARAASLAALGVSVAGNAVGHLVALDNAAWWKVALAILVGAVPPVSLAAVGHLLTLTRTPEPVPVALVRPAVVPDESRPSVQVSPATRTKTGTKSRSTAPTGTARRDKARALWDAAGTTKPTGAELARHAGVDDSLGRRWRREFQTA